MVRRFLSRFRQPKVNFELKVTDANFYPGSTVDVNMALFPQQQFAVRNAQLRLGCTEVWWKPNGLLGNIAELSTLLEGGWSKLAEEQNVVSQSTAILRGTHVH